MTLEPCSLHFLLNTVIFCMRGKGYVCLRLYARVWPDHMYIHTCKCEIVFCGMISSHSKPVYDIILTYILNKSVCIHIYIYIAVNVCIRMNILHTCHQNVFVRSSLLFPSCFCSFFLYQKYRRFTQSTDIWKIELRSQR